jgi:hypothetical protein
MKIIIAMIALLALPGCASTSQTYAPDGSQAYSFNCSGLARNWGMCYEAAGNACKEKGYTVVAGGTDQNTTLAANQSGNYGNEGNAVATSSHTRNIVVKCNK